MEKNVFYNTDSADNKLRCEQQTAQPAHTSERVLERQAMASCTSVSAEGTKDELDKEEELIGDLYEVSLSNLRKLQCDSLPEKHAGFAEWNERFNTIYACINELKARAIVANRILYYQLKTATDNG